MRSSRHSSLFIRTALLAAAIATAAGVPDVRAQAGHAGHALGKVTFEVSCSKEARAEFITAISLLHHMTYPQAREAFERTARVDPRCAMAHWGVAMTLFQPLWPTRPTPADLRRGWDETRKALELDPPTAREKLFIESAAAFFRDPGGRDYWDRIRSWESAMEKVHAANPEDPEAAAFYALALLATAPASGSSLTQPERAAALLLPIYERNPEHPGAMHYIVHASDYPGRET
ncbi:MAG TPA: hypothetical protein VFV54_10855, partial [Thermoanaerobaculia bacterium]|nr:hypothetical protein [Thermoanaerobaculia bacterium]